MKTKAVLFDLDGTLVDSLPLIVRTYRKVFDEMNIPWGNDDVVKMIGLPLKDIGRHFAGERGQFFEERYQHHYHQDHDRFLKLFPGTLELLEQLRRRGVRLGIVTSKGKPGASRAVAFTGLGCFMDVIVTAHDVLKHKPDPEPLLYALKFLGAEAGRSIFVGDSKFDIQTGQNAGTCTLGVTWGLENREDLERIRPDGLIDRWEELVEYL